jgi:8-oxo-dGTP pyrophosphatase MutT (NUDIX family)
VLANAEATTISAPGTTRADGLTHAGGVVYRRSDTGIEVLLVQASSNRVQWVLPKGHIESGEDPRVTAVREVIEESGSWTRVTHWLKDGRLGTEENAPSVRWFLMELVEGAQQWPEEERQHQWLTISAAIERARFNETKVLLEEVRNGCCLRESR